MSKSLTFLYVAAPRLFMLNFLRLSRHNTVLVLWLCSGTESTRSGSENIVVWRVVPVWFASWSQSVWLMWCSWCATHSNHDHICGDTLAANFTSWTDRGATWLNICYTSSPVYSSNIRRIFLSVIISVHPLSFPSLLPGGHDGPIATVTSSGLTFAVPTASDSGSAPSRNTHSHQKCEKLEVAFKKQLRNHSPDPWPGSDPHQYTGPFPHRWTEQFSWAWISFCSVQHTNRKLKAVQINIPWKCC